MLPNQAVPLVASRLMKMGLPAFSHYGQGTWTDGEGIAHSLGRNGFTPWFDQHSCLWYLTVFIYSLTALI